MINEAAHDKKREIERRRQRVRGQLRNAIGAVATLKTHSKCCWLGQGAGQLGQPNVSRIDYAPLLCWLCAVDVFRLLFHYIYLPDCAGVRRVVGRVHCCWQIENFAQLR